MDSEVPTKSYLLFQFLYNLRYRQSFLTLKPKYYLNLNNDSCTALCVGRHFCVDGNSPTIPFYEILLVGGQQKPFLRLTKFLKGWQFRRLCVNNHGNSGNDEKNSNEAWNIHPVKVAFFIEII